MLEIRNLTKIYEDGTLAVDNVSFTVPDGEFLIVIGLSGSGKSTLLRCINRLIDPTEGEIIWNGVDLAKLEVDDLWWEGDVLTVRLPEPEIFVATLDNDKSYVYDRQRGLFTRGDIHLETATRRVAEEAVKQAALEDDILNLAQVNAESYLYRLFHTLGIDNVVFVQPDSD